MEKNPNPTHFSFKAGEMIITNGIAKANPDQGEIHFFKNEDGLLCLQWKNLTKNKEHEPIACTTGEWEWKKANTKKGRVYYLQNLYYKDSKFLFWLQCPREMDDSLMTTVTKMVSTGELVTQVNTPTKPNQPTQPDQQQLSTGDFIKNLSEAMKSFQKKYPDLQKILTTKTIKDFISQLDKSKIDELIKFLPKNQQSYDELIDNISSPQFQQALSQLSHVLNSENLSPVLSSFGLDLQIATKYANGVQGFIQCIIEKFKKDKKEEKKE